ncbi:ribonucleases P/MRP protein subunit POP1 isoform X2 [Xenopus laevis]|uniref:Ribonucleases P/MRP protein subunit POP1 isoform X2 n=1 Tax=Xenopus laevis TaxID=8355 RepID=A0A8J1KYU9_XENLA|nr:ribonucleases P/MRP protein subunit POP1 isoform X2 [Xenopus laevis]
MSNAKEKKYAKRMRNQPSNVSLDIGTEQGDRPRYSGGRGSFQPHRESHPGPSGQHPRHSYQSPGSHFHGRGGQGRGGPSEVPLVPKYITATMFAQARAAEINAMVKAVSQKSSNTLVFQSLPRHMRRRAMGHDIKRLPRRLREIAKKEIEKSAHLKKAVSKNKCRKARRRHGNLQLEFNRRQRKNIWLETHVWHAKRFHMVKKCGYCLGHRPTMKSYRACYRAMNSHCLLQDLSYYCCLELMGEEAVLLNALSRLTSTETGPSFAAAFCLSGKRQGSLVLYRADKYPREAIGPVTFVWKPACVPVSPSDKRQLWIWCHPSLKQDILIELRQVCQCEETPDNAVCKPDPVLTPQPEKPQTALTTTTKKRKRQDKDGEQAVPVKKIIGDGTRDSLDPYYWISKQTAIRISDLTMEFVRYRLIGPLSHCVLTEALRAAPLHKEMEGDAGPHSWWADYCSNPENLRLHTLQESMLQLLQDRDQVKSIRLNGFPLECAQSLIWTSDICSKVTEKKVPEQEINRMRSELLVPGSRLELGNNESKIPVLLIQQPGKRTGNDRPGWGSGWDICLPKGWGMAFWIPFIYRGVRVGGLQQGLQHSQYMGIPDATGDFPDCLAGVQSAKEMEDSLLNAYKRRPPAKRANFIKHGVLAPFRCPWEQLTAEWEQRAGGVTEVHGAEKEEVATTDISMEEQHKGEEAPQRIETETLEDVDMGSAPQGTTGSEQDMEKADGARVCVLRNKRILKELSTLCGLCNRYGPRYKQTSSPTPQATSDMLQQVLHNFPRSLVWVRLTMLTKGSPELHAMICIPSEQDFIQLAADKSFAGPQEPKHGDPIKKKVLKHQKEKKKKAKAKLEKEAAQQKEEISQDDEDDQLTLGLWPNPLPPIINHCCRTLLGFVTHGDFSMAAGCGESLGFVSLTGLMDMLSGQPVNRTGYVLLRNPSSLQYRFAKIMVDA